MLFMTQEKMRMLIKKLEQALQNSLPGAEAQTSMGYVNRQMITNVPTTAVPASVMVLFYQKEEQWHIPLIQRTSNNPNDRHSGQISFPGGRYDDTDIDFEWTARREVEEEIGVKATEIQILGQLSSLYIPVSNFLVYPFVGYLASEPRFQLQASEVRDLIETPLSLLLDKKNVKYVDMQMASGFRLKDVPHFDVKGNVVWGATAMILGELLALLEQIN